jgi:uncharacterized protein YdiU (UPF0061 family)
MGDRLKQHNPTTILLRPEIEAVWERITIEDDWQPFYDYALAVTGSLNSR